MNLMRWFHVLIQGSRSCTTGNRNRIRRRPESLNCAAEVLEARALLSAPEVRSIDGSGNNVAHPDWGKAGSDLLRTAPAAYGDGISTPAGADRPNARVISNAIDAQGDADIENDRSMSDFIYVWGQFIDHDLDLTGSASPRTSFNITVPTGDPEFDPNSTGTQVIPLSRSLYDLATGTSTANPRQQINQITSFLDASMVYGSDAARADALRSHVGGKLLVSAGNMLPFNTAGLANANASPLPDNQLFVAGDVRANENIELTAMHTLFVREHNRLADQIHSANPKLTDDQIFQQARAIVGAEIQSITYNEFLPTLLGDRALTAYRGYNPNVNPGIANEFSTAIFRVGHTMLDGTVDRLDNQGIELPGQKGNVSLSGAFFNPKLLNVDANSAANPTGTDIDPFLKGIASGDAQEIDNKIIDEVRNFLFGPPGAGGLDLASLNIQRGRDHGLADYNTVRAAYGLPRVTSFSQITSNVAVQNQLKALYGNVNKIDLWVGALAEDHARGASVGPLVQKVIADQFQRLRDGDRFWFERQFSGKQLQEIEHTTLADIIRRNTGITDLQDNVFIFQTAITGRVFADANRDGRAQPNEQGVAGRKIELLDAAGSVIETTLTGKVGSYCFRGLELGIYSVREVLVSGVTQTTPAMLSVQLTRSMTVDHRDFGETAAPPQAPKPKPPAPPAPGKSSIPSFDQLAASQIGRLLNQNGPEDQPRRGGSK